MRVEPRSPATQNAPTSEPKTVSPEEPDSFGIRVGVVGDQQMVRSGIAYLLAENRRLRVVTERPIAEAVRSVAEHRPDVVVIVVSDDPAAVIESLVAILQLNSSTAVLLLAWDRDPEVDARAVALGARGVLMLDQPASLLLKAVEKVHAGELWLERTAAAGLMRAGAAPRGDTHAAKIASLTRREIEIVQLVGQGMRNNEIAQRLFISQATVRNHLTSVLSKLELEDRFDLAVYAFRHRLVRFP